MELISRSNRLRPFLIHLLVILASVGITYGLLARNDQTNSYRDLFEVSAIRSNSAPSIRSTTTSYLYEDVVICSFSNRKVFGWQRILYRVSALDPNFWTNGDSAIFRVARAVKNDRFLTRSIILRDDWPSWGQTEEDERVGLVTDLTNAALAELVFQQAVLLSHSSVRLEDGRIEESWYFSLPM